MVCLLLMLCAQHALAPDAAALRGAGEAQAVGTPLAKQGEIKLSDFLTGKELLNTISNKSLAKVIGNV